MVKKNILLIADAHGRLTEERIRKLTKKRPADAVFLLGDNRRSDLECLLKSVPEEVPKMGVVGNHDKEWYLRKYGIEDLHCRTTTLWGYTIGGFRGSIRYPNARTTILYTNRQSEEEIRQLGPCDILLTHDKPRFKTRFSWGVYNEENPLHSGLTGIGEYIRQYHPRYAFFGHLHIRYRWFHGRTRLQCCYGAQMVSLPVKGERNENV